MRWSPWLIAPLALVETACSSWYRAGPQVRTLDGRLAVEGKATVEGGIEQLVFPLALSGGVTPDDGEDVFALETGGEWVGSIDDSSWAYVAGPRFVGMLSGPSGTSLGLNAGPFVELDPESGDETVLSLELFAGGGLSGEVKNGFVGGATLSIGSFHRGVFTVPHGRLLRTDDGIVTAPALVRAGAWSALPLHELPTPDRVRQGREWLRAAQDEHASIAAFALLHGELAKLGAPASLLVATARAMLDEVRHTQLCFAIASAYLGLALGPGAIPAGLDADRAPSLPRLARHSLVDGCFGEGLAARIAWVRQRSARDPVIRAALGTIARDETRHAELGWQTLAWCLRVGGREIRHALADGMEQIEALECESEESFRGWIQAVRDPLRHSLRERLVGHFA